MEELRIDFLGGYSLDIDDLYNPAYSITVNSSIAKRLFEDLKSKSKEVKFFTAQPHGYNENDNCEVGFFINCYYVSYMMMDEDDFLIRIHVGNIDEDIYTNDKVGYMSKLNSCLMDFESKFNLSIINHNSGSKIQLNYEGHILTVGEIAFSHSGHYPNIPMIQHKTISEDMSLDIYLVGFNYTDWSKFIMLFEVNNEDNDSKYYFVTSEGFTGAPIEAEAEADSKNPYGEYLSKLEKGLFFKS